MGNETHQVEDIDAKYAALPELSADDIKNNSGIIQNGVVGLQAEMLNAYIVKALENPDWLDIPLYSEEFEQREKLGLPRPQHMTTRASLQLVGMTYRKSTEELREVAEKIRKNHLGLKTGLIETDIIARAFELIGQDYPNLAFYRGAEIDSDNGYQGVDFAPADLSEALARARSTYGKVRTHPVVVSITFADVAKLYNHHQLSIRTEDTWTRGSVEVSFKAHIKPTMATVRKYPTSPDTVAAIKQKFLQTAIKG